MTARTRVRRGTLAGIGAATLTAAAVLVGPSAAALPADDSGSSASTQDTTSVDDGGMDEWIPEDLQQDLQALEDVPADERAGAMQDIVTGALSGEYGEDIENRTEDLRGVWSSLPTNLRSDLASAFGEEPEQIGDELAQVFDNARSGEYGQSVESWTDWMAGTMSSWDVGSTTDAGSD
jgi:hypothetical protein